MKKGINSSYALLIVALIGPMVEEILFRLWLSFKKIHIVLSLIVICLVLIIKLNNIHVYKEKINNEFCYYVIWAIVFGFILFGLFSLSFFKDLSTKYFKAIYWGSCIGFGLIHIVNFAPFKLGIMWVYPLFIFPQLFGGFIFGFIRMKNGFFWALLIHCLVNLPGTIF